MKKFIKKSVIFYLFCILLFYTINHSKRVKAEGIGEGYYEIRSALNEKMGVEVKGGGKNAKENIQLGKSEGKNSQIFKVEKTKDGYYTIMAVCSRKVLDVQEGKKAKGTNVWQYDANGGNAQKWAIKPSDKSQKYFYIKSKLGEFNLDVSGGKATNGNNIRIWSCNGTKSQKFKFEKVDINKKFGTNYYEQYAEKAEGIKDYLLHYAGKQEAVNILVIIDKKFGDKLNKTFKNENKIKFNIVNSTSGLGDFSKYDLVINCKYKKEFEPILFKNAKVHDFQRVYASCLYQLTIDFLKENDIPIYFFRAPQASQIKNMNSFEKRICYGKFIPDEAVTKDKKLLDIIYGPNEECKQHMSSQEFSKSQVVKKMGSHHSLLDFFSKNFNIVGGHRVTIGTPEKFKSRVYMYGPCSVLGTYVADKYTIASFMQETINKDFPCTYKVENLGVYAQETNDFDYILDTKFRPGDIVIVERDFSPLLIDIIKENKCYYQELSPIFNRPNNIKNWIVNHPTHINDQGNKAISDYMYKFIKPQISSNLQKTFKNKIILFNSKNSLKNDPFIKENPDFIPYLNNLEELSKDLKAQDKKIGTLNLNCNPFTLGHRYLIEEALKRVDHLFIFVVEEDASEFSFKDRYEMVKLGTSDLPNITLLKTGKWMCSKFTFPEYFEKDNLTDKIMIKPTKDIEIYGEYIAPALGATVRFAGEEPLDPITRQHNNFMKNKLLEYGVEFCEIPRKTLPNGQPISASKARKLLRSEDFTALISLLPMSSISYIVNLLENK